MEKTDYSHILEEPLYWSCPFFVIYQRMPRPISSNNMVNLTQANIYSPNLTHASIYQRMPRLPSRRTTSRSGRYVLLRQIPDCHARGSAVDAWHANIHAHYLHPHKYIYTRYGAECMHASIIHTSSAHLCTSVLFAIYIYKIRCKIPACKHNSYIFCTFVYLCIVEAAWLVHWFMLWQVILMYHTDLSIISRA